MSHRRMKLCLMCLLLLCTMIMISSCGVNQEDDHEITPPIDNNTIIQKEIQTESTEAEKEEPEIVIAEKQETTQVSGTKEKNVQSEETKPATVHASPAPANSKEEQSPSIVTISVLGDEQKGMIIEQTELAFQDGDTVLDVLKRVTRSNKIPLEYRGKGILAYVEGIGNLYEFDRGPSSGWLLKVNGNLVDASAGAIKVDKGDAIEWIYSIELSESPVDSE